MGITSNRIASEQHFLIVPKLNTIFDEFCETFNIADGSKTFLLGALNLRYSQTENTCFRFTNFTDISKHLSKSAFPIVV